MTVYQCSLARDSTLMACLSYNIEKMAVFLELFAEQGFDSSIRTTFLFTFVSTSPPSIEVYV